MAALREVFAFRYLRQAFVSVTFLAYSVSQGDPFSISRRLRPSGQNVIQIS
jgi:hypothetical protein